MKLKKLLTVVVRTRALIIASAIAVVISTPLCAKQSLHPLWQIGRSDNNTAEFAHAPKSYQDYRSPGIFIVGQSDPKLHWPYVQPGIVDNWAPNGAHSFEVYFALKTIPSGSYQLLLDLVDTMSTAPPKISVAVNEKTWEFQTPKGAGDASVFGEPAKGREHLIEISVPANALHKGNNRITITTLSGSWMLWDALRLTGPDKAKIQNIESGTVINSISSKPLLVWHKSKRNQPITFDIFHIGEEEDIKIRVGKLLTTHRLKQGAQKIDVYVPEVTRATTQKIEVSVNNKTLVRKSIELNPVREWEIYLVHQTHLDIGFTHVQEEALKIQVGHLRTALKYIEETKDYPPESRHRWHPEGMWAVEEFMRIASESEKKTFLAACHNKQIHLDALYAQAMTGMYTDEELFELLGAAKRFEAQYGVPIISAMQSDVPGYTWGLVAALAHHDVSYLSVGPNWFSSSGTTGNNYYKGTNIVGRTHRGGRVFYWADQPFWWVSPSGKHKVLFWMPGWGYSGFHIDRAAIVEDKVLSYVKHLEGMGYPYDMVMWRYGIGADNGPPSLDLSKMVREWNENYVSPRLIITSNSDVMKTFEKRYGDQIPVIKGDYTPYWEDGSASTSKATSVNRVTSERLSQVQSLWAMLSPELKLHERFDVAWNKAVMYDEHTWGAYNSISAPDHSFAVQQDRYKQAYAFDGYRLTNELLADIAREVSKTTSSVFDVYNTASWNRNGLVLISKEQSSLGDVVKDDHGKTVPSQRLSSGELAFIAKGVPSFGARRYTIYPGPSSTKGSTKAEGLNLSNGLLTLAIEAQTGAISTLRSRDIDQNIVDTSKAAGLNDYLYIIGRDVDKNRNTIHGPVKITIEDPGPLVATVRIESDAPGCRNLIRRVRLVDGFDYVELINTTDKLKERRPEGLYFGFPFNIPNPVARIDVPWAVVQVEKDQIQGANRNFYCVQRWVDISNEDYGVTWVTVDAPMLQFDPIKIAQPFGVQHFREHIDPGAYIHSWTMNNHWETNFKADQEGLVTFRYALRPHAKGYDGIKAQQFGRGVCQPLIAITADPEKQVVSPMLKVDNQGVVITTIKPTRDSQGLLVRLFNTADQTVKADLQWTRQPQETWISNPMEEKLTKVDGTIKMVKYEIVTLRVQ
jgi:alpha-mannosidase